MVRKYTWIAERPRALVVACSDGRLQGTVDAFLAAELGIDGYDRLYLPGGPGALASCGELLRADVGRNDLVFLLEAHGVERLVFLFHGAAADGPEHALCADYRRRFVGRSRNEIALQQLADARLLVRRSAIGRAIEVAAYRADVQADHTVKFASLCP